MPATIDYRPRKFRSHRTASPAPRLPSMSPLELTGPLSTPIRPACIHPRWPNPPGEGRAWDRPLRVLTYSHDSCGLGHLRRTVTLATALSDCGRQVHTICITGSPVPETFELPEHCELIKLPAIGKDECGHYVSRRLPLPFGEIASMRSDLISATARAFRPDLLLVDHTATGPGQELLPVLRRLRYEGFHTRVVLGMRDVLDSPDEARAELHRNGTFAAIRSFYDEVLIYGQREVLDPVTEYGFPDDIAAKTRFAGMVVPAAARAPRPERDTGGPAHIVLTAGGGEDGYLLLRGVIAAMRGPLRPQNLKITIVTGPLLGAAPGAALRRAVQGDPRITLLRSAGAMQSLLDTADLVIAMGGYNSVYEALARPLRLLVLPRRTPRAEQWERCRRLADSGHLSLLEPEDAADPHLCAHAIRQALEHNTAPAFALRFDGAETAARACLSQNHNNRATPSAAASI